MSNTRKPFFSCVDSCFEKFPSKCVFVRRVRIVSVQYDVDVQQLM